MIYIVYLLLIENKLYYQPILHNKTVNVLTQHIYITSDEEIKEGDWFLTDDKRVEKDATDWRAREWHRKIILTTDPSLAPDVQKIDDEFLEWFVKNPSCEEVEVQKWFDYESNPNTSYKIIIPKEESENLKNFKKLVSDEISPALKNIIKEEQKQHIVDMMKSDEELGLYDETIDSIKLEEVFGSKHCLYSVIENKLAILYRNQEKILSAIKILNNGGK